MLRIDIQLFGGRGAASGGAGGNISVDVGSSTSLVSQRERKQREVDETLTAYKAVTDEYGYVIEDIQLATLKGRGAKSIIAFYDESTKMISTNEYFFDSGKMNTAYDLDVSKGFHPGRGKKSGTEAVALHELGHALTDEYATRKNLGGLRNAANDICTKAAQKIGNGATAKSIGAKISGYAKQNFAETVAEAFADVKCNGSRAKKESKAVVEILNSAW